MLGQDDLLLSTLDDGCCVQIVGFLELLSGHIAQLGICDERLCFGADKLLFESDQLRRLGLLILELLNFILNLFDGGRQCSQALARCECTVQSYLLFVVPCRLHASLGVPDLLQHTSAVLEVLSEQVLLLCNLCQQHSKLVTDVADSIVVGVLAPLAQLACYALRFLSGLFICTDCMVLGLDQ